MCNMYYVSTGILRAARGIEYHMGDRNSYSRAGDQSMATLQNASDTGD